ncbi:hypothetical protein HJFPF1_10464 [Paramyrothecium foliicola]|nr:hypothetical protein HJFPF1_10464 [Paramyrothecium foliicola]
MQGCITKGLVCDGYWVVNTPAGKGRALAVQSHAQKGSTQLVVAPSYETAVFKDDTQFNLFQIFVLQSKQGGSLPIAELISITPQVAQGSDALRHLCCAVAALMESVQVYDGSGFFEASRYQESVRYCNLALKSLRSVTPSTGGIRVALLASMLFATYEAAHGNIEASFDHFTHANRMMEQYLDLRCRQAGVTFENLRLDTFETAIFDMLQRLTAFSWTEAYGAPKTLDSNIVSCCRGHKKRYLVHDMPEQFLDVVEASRWWDITQHFIRHRLHARGDPDAEAAERAWTQSVNALLTWRKAFLPLLRKAKQAKQTKPHLYLQVLTFDILFHEDIANARTHRKDDANILPSTTPLYHEMLQTTVPLFMAEPGRDGTNAATEQIKNMAFIAYKCRDPAILNEIRSVLETVPNPNAPVYALMGLLTMREKQFRIKVIDRAWAWYFTSIGCGSGGFEVVSQD